MVMHRKEAKLNKVPAVWHFIRGGNREECPQGNPDCHQEKSIVLVSLKTSHAFYWDINSSGRWISSIERTPIFQSVTQTGAGCHLEKLLLKTEFPRSLRTRNNPWSRNWHLMCFSISERQLWEVAVESRGTKC